MGTYALTQFPSGILGDRFGERRVILVALGLTAISSLLLAVSFSYEFFVLFAIVFGLGAGLHYTVATTYLTKQFAWHIRPTEPDRPEQPMRNGSSTFFAEGQALSPATASALFSLYFVVHGLTQPLMGGLSDLIGRDTAAIVTMGADIVGYGLLVGGGILPEFVAGVLFVGLAMSWGTPIQSRFMDLFAATERGTGFGLVRTAYMTTDATGSVVIGALADLYGWDASFSLFVGIMIVCLGFLLANRLFRLGL